MTNQLQQGKPSHIFYNHEPTIEEQRLQAAINTKTTTQNSLQDSSSDSEVAPETDPSNFFARSKAILHKKDKKREKQMNTFLLNTLETLLDMFPDSPTMRYIAAYIYFALFQNGFKGLFELSGSRELKGSTLEHYNCYSLYMQITTQYQARVGAIFSLQSNSEGMYDTNQMIEFEKINILYQKEIEKSANYCQ